jgi:hypothetical protein
MAEPRDRRKRRSSGEVKDEPGAEERFDRLLKRALHTPPPRKQAAESKPKPKKR